MKKLCVMIFAIIAVVALSACRAAEEEVEQNVYQDGTFSAEGERWEYGYETADVTIENDVITDIVLHRLTLDGTEINYDEWFGGDNNRPNLKQYRIDIANEIISKQTTEGVDSIAGATVTTINWILAVERALEKAKIPE